MNPALPSTYAFLERVVADLVALHREAGVPLRNLHLGGDEVPGGVWERSPAVAGVPEGARARLRRRPLVRVLRPRRGDPEDARPRRPRAGRRSACARRGSTAGTKMIPNPDFARARLARVRVEQRGRRRGRGPRLPPGERRATRSCSAPCRTSTSTSRGTRTRRSRASTGAATSTCGSPSSSSRSTTTATRASTTAGNPVDRAVFVGKDRLTDYGRSNVVGIQGEPVVGDARRRGAARLHAGAEAPRPRRAGVGAGAGLGAEKDEAKSDALFRDAYSAFVNVVGKRELPRLDRETPAWNYRIPKPGLKVDGGQVRAASRSRASSCATRPTAPSRPRRAPRFAGGPARARVRVAAFDTHGRKGHTARLTDALRPAAPACPPATGCGILPPMPPERCGRRLRPGSPAGRSPSTDACCRRGCGCSAASPS